MACSDSGFLRRATGGSGSARRAISIAIVLCAASPAHAFFNDRLELFFSETATWDSNVFRLPRNVDRQATLGTSSLSDRILTHSVGLNADIPVSLQRFQASYQRFWTRYNRFDHLDFDGDIWRAAWLWAVTREFHGELGYTETTGLASFATFGGTAQDVTHTRQAFATANWQLSPRWIAYGGLNATEREHELPARRVHDIEAVSAEARLSYVTPRENRIGASIRFEDGGAPQTRLVAGIPFDNGYRQWGVGVIGRWDITVRSRLDGRADYVRREYDQFPERDYSGPAWGVTYTWSPTAKFSMATTLRRDIAPLEDVQTSFVLATGIGVKPRWEITEKFALLGSADHVRWKYRGDPLIGGGFEHRVNAASVGFAWTPFTRVVVTGALQRETRTSDLANADYRVTIGTLDARIGF
jgi:exopolysaccharide biosynthesis operon protein EpsL